MLIRRLAPFVALACLVAPASPANAGPSAVFATRITKERIIGHRAKFWFRAVHGTATGFRCTIYSDQSKVIPEPTPCSSPTLYTRLAAATWTFDVYAVNAAGTASRDASYTFTIA